MRLYRRWIGAKPVTFAVDQFAVDYIAKIYVVEMTDTPIGYGRGAVGSIRGSHGQ